MILSRLELETHPYQECTLPIKLKNLTMYYFYNCKNILLIVYDKSTQIWTENVKFEALNFTIKLYSYLELYLLKDMNITHIIT